MHVIHKSHTLESLCIIKKPDHNPLGGFNDLSIHRDPAIAEGSDIVILFMMMQYSS
jgi:hypothetical protein